MRFDAEFDDFYNKCLSELKKRPNYTDAFIPQLERYVTLTATLAKINLGIVDEEVTAQHTNKAAKTNTVTSPKWRMFLELNREANNLAKELELSPATAPVTKEKESKKGFDLTGDKMKVAS